MKTSTIVNASNVNNNFNSAIETVVNNSVEANAAIELMSKVMELTGYFEYFIAGGVYRDSLVNSEVSDVDIFLINIDRDAFKSIITYLTVVSGSPREYESDHSYGESTTSVRSGNINLVFKPQLASPQEVLEEFSASCSKIGKWVDGFNKEDTIFYCSKGMQNFLLNKTVEFFYDQGSYTSLRRYISKLSSKQWAKGCKFICRMTGFVDEYLVEQPLSISTPDDMHVSGIAFEYLGAFASNTQLKAKGDELARYIDGLNTQLKKLNHTSYSQWAKALRKGLLEMSFPEGLILLSEHGLVADVNIMGDYTPYYNFHDSIASQVGIWSRSQVHVYGSRKEVIGWGCLYVHNTAPCHEVKSLLDQGKLRLAFKTSTRLEVFLYSIGLGGKVVGSPEIDGNYFNPFGCSVSSHHAKRAFSGLKLKGKLLKTFDTYEELIAAAVWSSVLGSEYVHLEPYYKRHSMLASGYINGPIPMKYHSQIAKSSSLCDWVFEKKLQIIWDKKTAKECVLSSLANLYPEMDPKEIFLNPNMIEVLRYISEVPSRNVSHKFPEFTSEQGNVRMELLPKSDPINLYIGELTACCQKLGSVGEEVCTDGWNDPYSVNYIFKSVTSNKIIAHAWVWEDIEGNYVIDSLEGRAHADVSDISSLVLSFAKECKNTLGNSVRISKTGYGMTRDVISKLNLSEQTVCLESSTNYGYMDASIGQDLYIVD